MRLFCELLLMLISIKIIFSLPKMSIFRSGHRWRLYVNEWKCHCVPWYITLCTVHWYRHIEFRCLWFLSRSNVSSSMLALWPRMSDIFPRNAWRHLYLCTQQMMKWSWKFLVVEVSEWETESPLWAHKRMACWCLWMGIRSFDVFLSCMVWRSCEHGSLEFVIHPCYAEEHVVTSGLCCDCS